MAADRIPQTLPGTIPAVETRRGKMLERLGATSVWSRARRAWRAPH